MRKPVTFYHMNIYELNISELLSVKAKVKLKFKFITEKNVAEVAKLRNNSRLHEFKKILKQDSIGIAVYDDNQVIGYGWVKWQKCFDNFFFIRKNRALLASFYVDSRYRGLGIYPCIIRELIIESNKKRGTTYYLIGIQNNNISSIRGAKKVGFQFLKDYKLFRAFKVTIPKYKL